MRQRNQGGTRGRDDARNRSGAKDRGSATVEMALVLPLAVLLLAAGLGALVAVTYKLGCVARARDVALAAARGTDAPPSGAGPQQRERVEIGNDGTVTATVENAATSCTSTAVMEP